MLVCQRYILLISDPSPSVLLGSPKRKTAIITLFFHSQHCPIVVSYDTFSKYVSRLGILIEVVFSDTLILRRSSSLPQYLRCPVKNLVIRYMSRIARKSLYDIPIFKGKLTQQWRLISPLVVTMRVFMILVFPLKKLRTPNLQYRCTVGSLSSLGEKTKRQVFHDVHQTELWKS